MRTNHQAARRVASSLALSALALACGQAWGATYWLQAAATSVAMPNPAGGADVSVPVWGYGVCTDNFATCAAPSFPGPALAISEGDTAGLTVNLKNTLGVPTSLVVNGLSKGMKPVWTDGTTGARTAATQRVRSFDAEAAPNGGVQQYIWPNVKPGTYLYQSGTQPQVQVQMGLYGALSRNFKDATTGTPALAYDANTPYDNQLTLLYSEIDPALHAAVANGTYGSTGPTSTFDYQPKYFLINGKPYVADSTPALVPAPTINTVPGATSTTLLRVLNAGLTTHVPSIQGKYWDVVAEDGKRYPFKRTQYTALLPAAKTLDLMLTPDIGGGTYPIMDRRLNLSNAGLADGGMLAFLQYGATGVVGGTPGDSNVPPVANADSYSSIYGVELNVGAATGVLANDTDADGPQAMRAVATSGPTTAGGTYALNANGAFTYLPPTNGGGVDTFTYQVTDGKAISSGTVTITLSAPVAPALVNLLDNFDRGVPGVASATLGNDWSQTAGSTSSVNLVVLNNAASAADIDLGGQAIWTQNSGAIPDPSLFGASQYAAFTSAGSLANSGLILKASGGTAAAPANFVRVRIEDTSVVIATMINGGSTPIYFKQASFPAPATSGTLSAAVDAKGMVTVFINGIYAGGVQLPDVGAWKGKGRVGIQLQTKSASVDNFYGGSMP